MSVGALRAEVIRGGRRGPVISLILLIAAPALLAGSVVAGTDSPRRVALLAVVVAVVATLRSYVKWSSLLALTLITIMFVPIGRYSLPMNLPFQLEAYRVIVAIVLLAWVASLLVDPRVNFRPSSLHVPIYAFSIVVVLSLITNPSRVAEYNGEVVKRLMFFSSFILLYLMIVSVVRSSDRMWLLVRIFVGSGAVVAFSAVVESRTGLNVFDHLARVLPFLQQGVDPNQTADVTGYSRGGSIRAYASAQHPIALGAALVMLVPISVALARKTRQRRWWLAAAVLVIGSMATLSRASIIMLLVTMLVFARHRPAATKRLWPALLPLAVAIHLALPGTLGTLKDSFFPTGGLVAQQQEGGAGSGRLASLGPTLHNEFLPNPFFGEGFGTRITTSDGGSQPNASILDDEWVSVIAETGIAGTLSLLWVFGRFVRRTGQLAKRDDSSEGWLLTAMTASVLSFGVGMLTYDAFSFTQVTFLFFIVMAFGAVLYERGLKSPSPVGNRAAHPHPVPALAAE
jgi:hypothetical protein